MDLDDNVRYARKMLVRSLSANANSSDVTAIADAIERLIDEKIAQALANTFEECPALKPSGGDF